LLLRIFVLGLHKEGFSDEEQCKDSEMIADNKVKISGEIVKKI